jgi:AAA family ATP:ADP antiporter
METAAIEANGHSRLGRALRSVFPIHRNEVITVLLLTLNVFVLLTCYYVLKVVREPLILLGGGGGAELKAYASAGQTLLLLAVVPAFGMLASRVSRLRLLTIIQLFFAGCLVAFYLLAQAKAPVGLAFYLWLGIFNVLVVSNFWSFANDLYSEEEGKRLFAVIGVGASIGAILGAFVPQLLHRVIGGFALMLVAAGGLVLSVVLYRLIDLRERARVKTKREQKKEQAEAEKPVGKDGGFTLVIKDRYLRLLAVMLLVATIINTTGEYVVGRMASDASKVYAEQKVTAMRSTTTPAAVPAAGSPAPADKTADEKAVIKEARDEYISKFYSDYYTVVNLLSALLQALVVARLLTKFGIRRSLFIMPLVVVAGWAAALASATVMMMRIEKTAENSLDYSLHNTLRQALFLPTSRESKYKAKAAIDTFFFRMGDVIAGLGIVFLFVSVLGLGVRAFAIMNICLGALWLLLAFRTGKLHDKLAAEQAEKEARETAS